MQVPDGTKCGISRSVSLVLPIPGVIDYKSKAPVPFWHPCQLLIEQSSPCALVSLRAPSAAPPDRRLKTRSSGYHGALAAVASRPLPDSIAVARDRRSTFGM